ncbi:MAG: oxaloacetate decarboxylase subunit alpha [Clostridia bacterium]|nr:oxaloacetate decarboxylase subunit alpha [Clostridia bacterium]
MNRMINITETVLRDGHQSLMATRLSTEDMMPIIKELDEAGYYSLEMWGGATFDSCLRYLDEDPWERLRLIRKNVKNTKLQMLLRGQNLLGYKHYSNDVVDIFIKKSIENGIDIIRVFDALNDYSNLISSINSIKKYGGIAQAAIVYTTSPVHTIEYYVDLAKKLEVMGADSICIKDMSGILLPNDTYDLVKALKENLTVSVHIHTHCTAGLAEMNYMKAVEAGVDGIDTAISPFSKGTSQPPTESMAASLKNIGYDTNLNFDKLNKIADYFTGIREKYIESGIFNLKMLDTDIKTLVYQVPGGMLSNLMFQLKQQGMSDRFNEVLEEVPNIRKDLGYPPLVTPMSQMVGTQAVFNVMLKERYKMVPNEIKDYVLGRYGNPPVPIDESVKTIVLKNHVYEDASVKSYMQFKKEINGLALTEEDVLSYALFPDVARKFLENRWSITNKIENTIYEESNFNHPI